MSLKQRKIKFEPRIKLNHNTYSLLWRAIRITSESRRMHKQPLVVTTPPTRIPHALWKWVWGTPWVLIVPNPIVSFYCTAQQKLTKYKGKYKVIMQGLKKTWITALILWASSSHILLTWGHFLLILVNDLVRRWPAYRPLPIAQMNFKVT